MACKKVSEVSSQILWPHRMIASVLLMFMLNCLAFADNDLRFHKVRAKETLTQIAKSHNVSYRYLACLNGIDNPSKIQIGQRIVLPHAYHAGLGINLNWPIKQGMMTSPFGPRRADCHYGVDIAAPFGTPIFAAESGKVAFSGVQNGYGKVIIIQHTKTYHTLYAHLQKIYVKANDKVKAKQRIAKVGSNGRSTGAHLHFEVWVDQKASDPMFFLPQKTQVVFTPKFLLQGGIGGK